MEKKEDIREYLQKMLNRWNKYDELDGFVAESFRVDLEKTLEYWDLRIADNKQELDKAKEEERFKVLRELSLEIDGADLDNYITENTDYFNRLGESMMKKVKELVKLKDNK